MNITKSDTAAVRDMLEKALEIYNTPKECMGIALAFIDGLKVGAKFINTTKENERMKNNE